MQQTTHKQTILVVEDNESLLRVIRDKLKGSGFAVLIARTAEQAFARLKSAGRIDLIWLDHILMGKETGFGFLTEIKKHKQWRDTPVFVVSNTGSEDKKHVFFFAGADKYYVKAEYRLDDIVRDIKEFLKEHPGRWSPEI